MKWISVKDQSVPKNKPILVWAEHLQFPISIYWKEEGTYGEPSFFENGDEYEVKEEDIVCWIPLPEPPK